MQFLNILHEHTEAEIIFTDGSKTVNGVGCAFVIGNEIHSWTLPNVASIYTAEMYAIWQALLYCEVSPKQHFLICTDSLSSLQSISNIFNSDPLPQNVIALLNWLKRSNKNINFIFTPSHVGIRGNEEADAAARLAAENIDHDAGIPVRDKDVIMENKNVYQRKWQNIWNEANTSYKRIHPNISTWKFALKLTRKEQTVITRLKIGHTHLTSFYLLRGQEVPNCTRCDVPLTVVHILIECPIYTNYRFAVGLANNVENVLQNNKDAINKLLAFLKLSQIFHKI